MMADDAEQILINFQIQRSTPTQRLWRRPRHVAWGAVSELIVKSIIPQLYANFNCYAAIFQFAVFMVNLECLKVLKHTGSEDKSFYYQIGVKANNAQIGRRGEHLKNRKDTKDGIKRTSR